jgi:hypothetical protein
MGIYDVGRRALERQMMLDRCRITDAPARFAGTLDPVSRQVTFPEPSEIYVGRCQVDDQASSRTVIEGGQRLEVVETVIRLPGATSGLKVGQIVTITAAEADPDLVDTEYIVKRVHAAGLTRELTTRRLDAQPAPGGVS